MKPSVPNLEIIRDEAAFLALEPHWERLHEASAVHTPFRTWDWSRLWWKHYRDRCQLRIGVLRDATGTPQAIAPFVLGREESSARHHLRYLSLLGGLGEVVSEGLDFFVPAGQEAALIPAFAPLLKQTRSEWDLVDLPMLQEDSPSIPHLRKLIGTTGRTGERSVPQEDFILALPSTWDELLGSLSGNRRSDYRSKWKKLVSRHAGRGLIVSSEQPLAEAFDELVRLHRMRFTEEESSFLSPTALAFHRDLSALWLPAGKLMITMLEADGRPASVRYGLIFGGRYWDYQSGYDSQYGALSLGNLNVGWTAQCAIERGLTEYDHLAGDLPYKRVWSTRSRRLLHLESFNSRSPRSLVFRLARKAKRLVARRQELKAATQLITPA